MALSGPPRFDPAGSFRDPDTRIFHHDGAVFRALSERALYRLAAACGHPLLRAVHRTRAD